MRPEATGCSRSRHPADHRRRIHLRKLFIAQRIVLKIENLYLAQGRMPPVLCSANLPGGDEYNTSAVAAYQGRIKALC